jgi:hypothetical protein
VVPLVNNAPGDFTELVTSGNRLKINIVRAGLNWRFNWWPGPVATRY